MLGVIHKQKGDRSTVCKRKYIATESGITKDWAEVTCKHCLKHKPKELSSGNSQLIKEGNNMWNFSDYETEDLRNGSCLMGQLQELFGDGIVKEEIIQALNAEIAKRTKKNKVPEFCSECILNGRCSSNVILGSDKCHANLYRHLKGIPIKI